VTLPALMQDVQTFKRFGVPPTLACTVWMFGSNRRLVRRCEWEIACPKPGPLPQTSQLAATVAPVLRGSPLGRRVGECRAGAGNRANLAEWEGSTQIDPAGRVVPALVRSVATGIVPLVKAAEVRSSRPNSAFMEEGVAGAGS
jgi:hypothetical protein